MSSARALLLIAALMAPATLAQTPKGDAASAETAPSVDMPAWQKAAGGKMEFDVASVRPYTGDFKPPSIALSNDDGSQPKDGLFHSGFPLSVDIEFAYKISLAPEQEQAMLAPLAKWVRTDRYEIEARSPGKPTKDQVRLMMQSLLAERFGLKVHIETRIVPVFAMTLVKPGKLGPNLIPHAEALPCPGSMPPGTPQPAPPANAPFPYDCGIYAMHRDADGSSQLGSRNTTMSLIAAMLPTLGALGKPVVDQSGLTGNYDISVKFSMEATRNAMNAASTPPGAEPPAGITFMDAVREQLGLKLEPSKGPVQMLVIDHIERPTEN
jgi:bla regulator protein blaR1